MAFPKLNATVQFYIKAKIQAKIFEVHVLTSRSGKRNQGASMADLHDDVTYKGWSKTSAAGHSECMKNSKCVLRRSISLLHGKTDHLNALIVATWRVGVFISESDGFIAIWFMALIDWKATDVSADDVSSVLFLENG